MVSKPKFYKESFQGLESKLNYRLKENKFEIDILHHVKLVNI